MKIKFNFITLFIILCILLSISSAAANEDIVADDALDSSQADMAISEINDEDSISDSNEMALTDESSNSNIKDTDNNILKDGSTLSFSDLAEKIGGQSTGNLTIEGVYVYDETRDSTYKNGIELKNDDVENEFTIIGNNLVIDGNNQARAFNISGLGSIGLMNVMFINCFSEDNGGAIHTTSANLYINNTTFIANNALEGGAIYNDGGYVKFNSLVYNSSLANKNGTFEGNFSLNDSNLTNIGGSLYNIGTFNHSNIVNENGNLTLGLDYTDNEAGNEINVHYTSFKNGNITNNYGNLTCFGNVYGSEIINNHGNLDFPAYSYYSMYLDDESGEPYFTINTRIVGFSQSNLTNIWGNVSCECGGFHEFNIINDYGNINFSAINPTYDIDGKKEYSRSPPYFSGGNLTNIGGNFTSESGNFYDLNLSNNGIFTVTNFTYDYVYTDPETGISTFNSTISKGHFSGINVTNDGVMDVDLFAIRYSNLNNTGSFASNSTWTHNNNFTNSGNFRISEVYYTEEDDAYNYNVMYNNTFVNYGNFLVEGNSTYMNYDDYYYETVVYDGFSQITNHGIFKFDGGDSQSELVNYTISNDGDFIWTNVNTTQSVNVENSGTVRFFSGSLINGTTFSAPYGNKGKIIAEGINNFSHAYVYSNDFDNLGQTTMDTLYFMGSVVNNHAYLDINGSSFNNGEILNSLGVIDMSSSNVYLCNITVYDGAINFDNNKLTAQIKNWGSITSLNDNYTAYYDFWSRYNYYCIVSYKELIIENADLPSIPVYNIGGFMTITNSSLKQAAVHNYRGGYVGLYSNRHFNNDTVLNHMGKLECFNETFNETIFKIARPGDTYVYNSDLENIYLNQTAGNLTFVNCSVRNVNIENYNRAIIAFEGNSSFSDSSGSGGSIVNRGQLNITNIQFEGNGSKGTGVKNYGEMNWTDSSIKNTNITNEGTLNLLNTDLENIDIINRAFINASNGNVIGVTVYSDCGEISADNSEIATNVTQVTPIVANNLTTDYGSGVYFGVNYTDAYGNVLNDTFVTMVIDGRDYYTKTDENGYAFVDKQLAAGKRSILVINPSTLQNKTFTATINKLSSNVTVNKIVEYYGARKYLKITVVDSDGKGISGVRFNVTFNKKEYRLTSKENGVVKYKIPLLNVGKYTVTVKSIDKRYKVPTTKSTITVKKAKTKVKAPKVTAKYKQSKYFKLIMNSTVTKKPVKKTKISVKVYTGKKFKTYKLTTNTKGFAKFRFKNLRRGTHKVVIGSLNKNYRISKKSSIVIK